MLSLQESWAQSLVRELRAHMPKKKKNPHSQSRECGFHPWLGTICPQPKSKLKKKKVTERAGGWSLPASSHFLMWLPDATFICFPFSLTRYPSVSFAGSLSSDVCVIKQASVWVQNTLKLYHPGPSPGPKPRPLLHLHSLSLGSH